ncbi:MAG TPA: hypothetical protein VN852_02030 [Candidatus Krumholzibacteria bacterium]|nr:hypothetical protein [Candidatus Krumholzibacteria bacterium]
MDRKKPKLTSPWKVGFLVALLLVVTALGVSYFITGTFGITWHWIQFGGLSPMTWTFHLGAFLEEMAPLLLITSLLAFGSYVLVAGAVRRYKAYVDSGVEYKQLLKSIKSIEDLEDADLVDRLKSHPELREFLMGVKHRVSAHERGNTERVARHMPPATQSGVDRAVIAADSATLVSAIDSGRDDFPREMTLTIPEMKQIEHAIRRCFAGITTLPATDASAGALEELRNLVGSTVEALRRDIAACGSGAREVEEAAAALQGLETGAAQPAGNTSALGKRIDDLATALVALGEETKRIAIASAMQASGGPAADTIKVADELKTLATRFNTVARHWSDTTPAIKELISGSAAPGARSDVPAAAANVSNRARLWGERAVAMNEHVRSLERAIGVKPAAQPAAAPQTAANPVDLDVAPAALGARNGDVDLAPSTSSTMFSGDRNDDINFADIPGFEKERRFFADPPADGAAATDDRFVVDGQQDRRWDLSEEQSEETSAAPDSAPKKPAGPDNDGFLTGPRPTVRVERPSAAPKAAPAPRPAVVELEPASSTTATLDPDADAVDLYALGAIDCVQTV